MTIPTVQEVHDFKTDIDASEEYVNSDNPTFDTRLGGTKDTISGILSKSAQGNITAYSAAATYDEMTDWVEEAGVVYRPLPSALPIGPESFDSDNWIVAQDFTDSTFASISSMTTYTGVRDTPGKILRTSAYNSTAPGIGAASYVIKTAAQAATDGDDVDEVINHTLASGNVAILIFNGAFDLAWAGCDFTGTTNSAAAVQIAVDKYSEIYFGEGSILINTKVVVPDEGVKIRGAGKDKSIFTCNADITVFEHSNKLSCQDFRVQQLSANQGIAFATARDDDPASQALVCEFLRVRVVDFDYSWWYRASVFCTWRDCFSTSLVGIRFARSSDPYDRGLTDAPGGWNAFSPNIGWFHNSGVIERCVFEDIEAAIWGCCMGFSFISNTTQRQEGSSANQIIPLGASRTGIWLHSGEDGDLGLFNNTIISHYSENCQRPFYFKDLRTIDLVGNFAQGESNSTPADVVIEADNAREIRIQGSTAQDWFTNKVRLSNQSKLFGAVAGSNTGDEDVIDSTSEWVRYTDFGDFTKRYVFSSSSSGVSVTLPDTLENRSIYRLSFVGLRNGTNIRSASYNINYFASSAVSIDLISGTEVNFSVSVSGGQISFDIAEPLALSGRLVLEKLSESKYQETTLTPA